MNFDWLKTNCLKVFETEQTYKKCQDISNHSHKQQNGEIIFIDGITYKNVEEEGFLWNQNNLLSIDQVLFYKNLTYFVNEIECCQFGDVLDQNSPHRRVTGNFRSIHIVNDPELFLPFLWCCFCGVKAKAEETEV